MQSSALKNKSPGINVKVTDQSIQQHTLKTAEEWLSREPNLICCHCRVAFMWMLHTEKCFAESLEVQSICMHDLKDFKVVADQCECIY